MRDRQRRPAGDEVDLSDVTRFTPVTAIALFLLAAIASPAPRVAILDGPPARMMLRQCSRAAPAALGMWKPAAAQVDLAEALIPAALAHRSVEAGRLGVTGLADLRSRWRVEATGVTSAGRRLLYLNFVPRRDAMPGGAPTIVCDGGPQFFGATVDLATGKVVALDFNGMA